MSVGQKTLSLYTKLNIWNFNLQSVRIVCYFETQCVGLFGIVHSDKQSVSMRQSVLTRKSGRNSQEKIIINKRQTILNDYWLLNEITVNSNYSSPVSEQTNSEINSQDVEKETGVVLIRKRYNEVASYICIRGSKY